MNNHTFIFADLSTYDLEVTMDFYHQVFGWEYHAAGNDYFLAYYHNKEVGGLYETPEQFRRMNMPSFWMSYIQVAGINETVTRAKALGGIVELVDSSQSVGKIALIRDPLGAGFTVYDGGQLHARFDQEPHTLVWNELFVSDLDRVRPFYEGLFSWRLEDAHPHRLLIKDSSGKSLGAIQEVSNELKGKKEYWGVFFGSKKPAEIIDLALKHEGKLLYQDAKIAALTDPFGALFHISQV